MFERLLSLLNERQPGENISNEKGEAPAGFTPFVPDVRTFTSQYKLKDCKARTLSELIAWLETLPAQKWYVTKTSKKKASLRTIGVYEEFPDLEVASSWLTEYGGGKYYVKPLLPGKIKIGCYEFEGEDKEPEDQKDELNRKIEELKEELHRKDMQLIEERFKRGEKSGGWDAFARLLESDTGKELAKEAIEAVRDVLSTRISGNKELEEEKFEEFISKT